MEVSNKPIEELPTEERILRAAEHEFFTKGYAGARTTSIAHAAGVTHAMFHYYFRTKERLFEQILSNKLSLLMELAGKTVNAMGKDIEAMVWEFVDGHIDFLAANPELPHFLICDIMGFAEREAVVIEKIKRFIPELVRILQMKIDTASEKGLCRRVDARMLILDIMSLNVFSFVASPFLKAIIDDAADNNTKFLEMRKRENFETIMRKLKQ